ncbi:MAG: hypothetical protein DI537_10135 [Stutzerimonas stutzeri]|nr:MAG: hypothetical protein DI537_10135 [Stutzerimonas stutzeri]
MKSLAQERIIGTPLKAVGTMVRVASDNYQVATVHKGMNDASDYARIFAAAPVMMDVILFIEAQATSDPSYWRKTWPQHAELFDAAVVRWAEETLNGARPSPSTASVFTLSEAVHHWCNLPLMRKALAHVDYVADELRSAA